MPARPTAANDTGHTIGSLAINDVGETWRLGQDTAGHGPDRLDFQFSLDATSLSTGTGSDFDVLDFSSPTITGTVEARNGNSAANEAVLTGSLSGLSLANGATFWLRWNETDLIPGAEDGLVVDDFSLTPFAAVPIPAAFWLLFSGLAGLAALRHRSRPELCDCCPGPA